MSNIIHIDVAAPDEILNAGAFAAGAVIRLQTSATETGAYADVSGTGSTPTIAVVTLTNSYTGYDPNGSSSSWYRTRYENSAATRLSDWSAVFQAGGEEAGWLCSLYDAERRLVQSGSTLNDDERALVMGYIPEVSDYIRQVTGRRLSPDPLSGTKTYRVHTKAGRVLWLPRGIRSITTLGVASTGQPSSGGTYTTATAADYYIDPPEYTRQTGWPGSAIVIRSNASGPVTAFSDAEFGAEIAGAFDFAATPAAISHVALNLVVAAFRDRASSGGGGITINVDGSRTYDPMLTNKDRATLVYYSLPSVL